MFLGLLGSCKKTEPIAVSKTIPDSNNQPDQWLEVEKKRQLDPALTQAGLEWGEPFEQTKHGPFSLTFYCRELKLHRKIVAFILSGSISQLNRNKIVFQSIILARKSVKEGPNWTILNLKTGNQKYIKTPTFDNTFSEPSFSGIYMAYWESRDSSANAKCKDSAGSIYAHIWDLEKNREVASGFVGCCNHAGDTPFFDPPEWVGKTANFKHVYVDGELKLKVQ